MKAKNTKQCTRTKKEEKVKENTSEKHEGEEEKQTLWLCFVWQQNTSHSPVGKKNARDYVMEVWWSLVDYPFEEEFDECLKKFEIACSPWPMFVDYVNQTWIIPYKERFVKA